MRSQVKITVDNVKGLEEALQALKSQTLLVGIPQGENEREENQPIGNAALLYIHEHGSPVNNIPPRPVMSIGLKKSQKPLIEEFRKGAKAILDGKTKAVDQMLTRAGFIATTAIKKVIDDQDGIEAPADSTLKARKRKGFEGEKALLVSGQLRNAITFVIEESE